MVVDIQRKSSKCHLLINFQPCCPFPDRPPLCLQYKLCKVKKLMVGTKGIPHLVTHDARTIRYPDPLIKVNDTVRIDLDTGKITDFIKFDTGKFLSRCSSFTFCHVSRWL